MATHSTHRSPSSRACQLSTGTLRIAVVTSHVVPARRSRSAMWLPVLSGPLAARIEDSCSKAPDAASTTMPQTDANDA